MKRAPASLPPEHCLLSEFDGPWLRWLRVARSKHAANWMAVGCFIWAAAMLWLGDRLQVNAMGLGFHATALAEGGKPLVTANTRLTYGWMAQINEGLFYLIMGPLLIVMTHRFLIACGEALQQLHQSGRLKTVGAGTATWSEEMARRNLSCGLPLLTFPLFIFICLSVQLPSINRTSAGYPTTRFFETRTDWQEIGYVQSLNFGNWTNSFQRTNVAEKIRALREVGSLDGLGAKLFDELDRANLLTNTSLARFFDYQAGKPKALRLADAMNSTAVVVTATAVWPGVEPVGWLPGKEWSLEVLKGRGVVLDEVQRSLNAAIAKSQHLDAEEMVRKRNRYVSWFKTFIVLSQLQIAAFFTFMTWLLWKMVFWLVQVYRLLPSGLVCGVCERWNLHWNNAVNGRRCRRRVRLGWLLKAASQPLIVIRCFGSRMARAALSKLGLRDRYERMCSWVNYWIGRESDRPQRRLRFLPVLNDPKGRYGLGALFRPYNQLVLVVAIGSSFIALHFPDGAGLEAITEADGAGNGATRIGNLFAVGAAITAVLIGPLWLYPTRLRRWAESNRVSRLRHELAQSQDPKALKDLLDEEATILDQSTWPRGDNRFRLTLAIVFAVLLLPVGTALNFLPGDVTPFTRLPQLLRTTCNETAARVYNLDQIGETR